MNKLASADFLVSLSRINSALESKRLVNLSNIYVKHNNPFLDRVDL